MKVHVNDPQHLPNALRGKGICHDFEVLKPGDYRLLLQHRNFQDPHRYLLVMPEGEGHTAYTTVSAWYVPTEACTVLEE